MSEQTPQANGAAEGLREVPADLVEYQKFVAEGGHEHNAKIRGREEAEKAARDAGLQLAERDEHHKPKNGFQARINRLQRKIGERDQRIADLEKRASAQPAAEAPAKPDAAQPAQKADAKTPPRPEEKDFKTYSEFVEALTEWKTDRKLEAREALRAENRQQSEVEQKNKAVIDAHNARVDEAKTRYAEDWDKAFKGLDDNSFSDPMVVYIFESDKGPDITYYLATHRKELAKIREMSPLKQAAALGRIEDRLSDDEPDNQREDDEGEDKPAKAAPAKAHKTPEPADDEEDESDEEDEKPAPRKSTHSKAPAPAKPLGGRGAADDAMPDPANFVEYEKWAKRQQAKGAKR